MVAHGEVFLHFIELRRVSHVDRVLLRVKGAGFERGVQLGNRHRRRVHAQQLESLDVVRVGCRADLQALEVFRLVDRALVVGEGAPAVFPVSQAFHAVGRKFVKHAGADGAVKHVVSVLRAAEHERQFHGGGVGHDAVVVGGAAGDDVDGAAAHAVDHGRVIAQLVGREDGDFNITFGALFHQLRHFHGGCMLAVCRVNGVTELEVEFGGKGGSADRGH